MTNAFSMEGWPRDQNSVVVVGTNFAFGNSLTCTNRPGGGGSNAAMPNTYRVFETNSGFGFFVTIPDTTNVLPLTTYAVGTPTVFPAASLYALITNAFGGALVISNAASVGGALGYVAQDAAAIGTIARRGSNDFALSTSVGPIATRSTNDFALAASIGTIASRGSNDFALAASVGPMAARSTNDFFLSAFAGTMAYRATNEFALTTAHGLEQPVGARTDVRVSTNGSLVLLSYATNGLPGSAFTNFPPGSILVATNGAPYILTNAAWHPISTL